MLTAMLAQASTKSGQEYFISDHPTPYPPPTTSIGLIIIFIPACPMLSDQRNHSNTQIAASKMASSVFWGFFFSFFSFSRRMLDGQFPIVGNKNLPGF